MSLRSHPARVIAARSRKPIALLLGQLFSPVLWWWYGENSGRGMTSIRELLALGSVPIDPEITGTIAFIGGIPPAWLAKKKSTPEG